MGRRTGPPVVTGQADGAADDLGPQLGHQNGAEGRRPPALEGRAVGGGQGGEGGAHLVQPADFRVPLRADQPVRGLPRLLLALLAAVDLVTARAGKALSDRPVLLHRLAQRGLLQLLLGEHLLGSDETLDTVGAAWEFQGGQSLRQQHGLVGEDDLPFLHGLRRADCSPLEGEGDLHGHVLGQGLVQALGADLLEQDGGAVVPWRGVLGGVTEPRLGSDGQA